MIEGYCVKCKAKRPIAEAVEELMKNGRKAVKGKCPICGAVMFKILGGKVVSPASPEPDSPSASDPDSGDPAASAAQGAAPEPAVTPVSELPDRPS